ncbi:MAG: hypothetical protein FJY80_04890 [Candidatus Aminicenantes bacterium]|nr:hypothetical protein [Candidatus Aminicenantes bacterium]
MSVEKVLNLKEGGLDVGSSPGRTEAASISDPADEANGGNPHPSGAAEAQTDKGRPAAGSVTVDYLPEIEVAARVPAKAAREAEETIDGPVGLDIGTTHVVLAEKKGGMIRTSLLPNAFFTVPFSNLTKQALLRDKVIFFEKNATLYLLGHSAEDFASIFRGHLKRPIENGILNSKESESEAILKAIVQRLVKSPKKKGERACFSMPGEPLDKPGTSLIYHESIIKEHLTALGYDPVSVNEGMAVVLSELAGSNFTGIGISLGGGMCNVCFSYLTVPVVTFSLLKGGDFIDQMVAQSIGEPVLKVKHLKESVLDLSASPRDKIEMGLHIYYDDLFTALLQHLQNVLASSDNIPRLARPLPIVLGGGTALPRGVRERFWKHLKATPLPCEVSEVVLASKPLYATAKGALMMALLGD